MKGVKMHLGNGGVTLRDPAHAARIAEDARLFLERLVAVAPSIEIAVAHFGGAGPGCPAQADEVMVAAALTP